MIMNSFISKSLLSADHPFWISPFRPFYMLGAIYGPLLIIYWLVASSGLVDGFTHAHHIYLWHGHELVFGFAGAIISGFVLTALPSWAGTEELAGGRLTLLVLLWIAGRLAVLASSQLSGLVVMVVDTSLFVVMGIMIAPMLLRVRNKVYLLLLLIFAGLFAGNLFFHLGLMAGDMQLASFGLRLGIYSILFKFVLVGGYLTPIFTNNHFKEGGVKEISFHPLIETLAIVSTLGFIASDIMGMADGWCAALALFAGLSHGVRLIRWRSWQIMDKPVVFMMHLAYAWLVTSFLLRALSDYSDVISQYAWLHAFTVGALGHMMLGLMTRVVLRHTGRPLKVVPILLNCYRLMFVAALLRVLVALFNLDYQLMVLSALLWAIPFLLFLKLHGGMLLKPSLPR